MISSPFRWGILGPGKIAKKFAASLPYSRNGVLTAVASRTPGKAETFVQDFPGVVPFSSYTELLKSGLVDAVYVAGTHNLHREQATLCLQNGISVLCEKPLTESEEDTFSLYAVAASQNTFLMEGMWSVFLPHIQRIFNWIEEGKIGKIIHVQADFAYKADRNPENRLFNPALGGSVSKDIGIYPLFLFHKLGMGIKQLQHLNQKAGTGVDEHVIFQGFSNSEFSFQGMISFCGKSQTRSQIIGSEGIIEIDNQWFRPVSARLVYSEGIEEYHPQIPGFGFQFEADEVENCVRQGKISSEVWKPADSQSMAKWIALLQS